MAKATYNNMKLKPDFKHLPKHLPAESILKEWGGELDFNLNTYLAWRASEEGVMLDASAVRQYGGGKKGKMAKTKGGGDEEEAADGTDGNPLQSVSSVRCTFSTEIYTRGCPWEHWFPSNVPTPAHLKLLHVCGQWHTSRKFTPPSCWHFKLRPNAEGRASQPWIGAAKELMSLHW
jgi:hypothetical protein